MKKNLLAIIILALLVVNIVMTAFMMFTVIPANKKTIALVNDIAGVMNLELTNPVDSSAAAASVSVDDTVTYDIADQLTISLKKSEGDDAEHYVIASISLYMNSKDEDYKTYGGEAVAQRESMIKNEINDAIGSYTYEEAQALGNAGLQDAVLEKIQSMYNSRFIYKVGFRNIMVQ